MGLFDNMLSGNQSLIKDEIPLDYDFVPKLVKYREAEQRVVANCIRPLFMNRTGKNVLIYGKPGVGKTLSMRKVLDELEEKADDIELIYINCWNFNTSYKVFVEIARILGNPMMQNRKTHEVLEFVKSKLNELSVVFVFDEIDRVEETDFLYSLMEGIFRKTIILVTNYKSWIGDLDERVSSRLCAELLEFKAYSRDEVRGILKSRIDYGLVKGVFDDSLLDVVVEKTFELSDIRSGLFLIRESVLIAESESSTVVMLNHVLKAIEKLSEFKKKSKSELSSDLQEILDFIDALSGFYKIGELYDLIVSKGVFSGSYRTFQRKIARLQDGGYIVVKRQTGAGGNTKLICSK